MRIDHHEPTRRIPGTPGTPRGRASGPGAASVWTLTGVALLAACAHDGAGYLLETGLEAGGGATGASTGGAAAAPSGMAALAAIAVVGIGVAASNGGGGSSTGSGVGGDGGSGGSRAAELEPLASYQLHDTVAADESAGDYPLSAPPQRFSATHPDGEGVSYFATSSSGAEPGGGPQPARAASSGQSAFETVFPNGEESGVPQRTPASRYDENAFNYGSMVEGAYGTLFYNSRDGHWTYEADPAKVNPLKEAETRQEVFLITAVDARGVSSAPQRLAITINGKDEAGGVNGAATWSADAAKVGDSLTVTLTDSDGIPVDDPGTLTVEAPRFEFFHASDTSGTGRTAVDRQFVTATSGSTASVSVVQAHVGRHIGVEITYTDINDNDESVIAYANTAAGVAGFDAPGEAAFDPGERPLAGTTGTYTVRLADANMPASVTYQFFYSDDKDEIDPAMKTVIGGMPMPKTGADRFVATLTEIPGTAHGKYIGVEISYDDGVGDDGHGGTSDLVRVFLPETVATRRAESGGQPEVLPRNYGPTIGPDNNKVDNLWWSLPATHRGETPAKVLVFGERGYRNDPQHTPQDLLQLSLVSDVAAGLTSRASADPFANRLNIIAEQPWGVDYTYNTKYGSWRFDRVDEHSALTAERLEEDGALFWTYELGRTDEMRAAITADIGERESVYDQMFIQVSDGRDTDIVRLSVEIMGAGLVSLGAPSGHVPDPDRGAAPTLNPHKGDPHHLATTVFYEGRQPYGWDVLNKHLSETRELNFGDHDTDDADLTIVYHIPQTPMVLRFTDWYNMRELLDFSGDIANTGTNILVDPKDNPHHYQTLEGHFGLFNINRVDEHGGRVADGLDETGALYWNYNMVGDNENSVQNANLRRLNDGEYGFEIVYLQAHDGQGNTSDVRWMLVPIAGRNGNYGAEVNPYGHGQITQWWMDAYDELHGWDTPASSRTNNRGDASFDDTTPEVGDTLTLTVTDADGITAAVNHTFFHAADPSGAGRTDISIGSGNTVAVTAAHAGRYIGVDVSYVDVYGNHEFFTRYTAAVRAPNIEGDATFDDATPQVGETLAVDVTDADGTNGVAITYDFFHADDTSGTGRTAIGTAGTARTVDILQAHVGKYIGVDVTYTDELGNSESLTGYTAATVEAAPNTPPTAADARGDGTSGDTDFDGFAVDQFMFMDADGDMLDHITIKSITGPGTLSLDTGAGGDAGAVSVGDDIDADNIQHLTFMPTSGTLAAGDLFTFSVNDGTDDSLLDYTFSVGIT